MHANEDIWGIRPIKEVMGMELAVTRAAMVTDRTMTSRAAMVISLDRRMTTRAATVTSSNWRVSSRVVMSRMMIFMDLIDFWMEG